jgi:hypothetical protein
MIQRRKKQTMQQSLFVIAMIYMLGLYGFTITGNADDISIIPGGGNGESTEEEQTDSGIDIFEAQAFIVSNYQQSTGTRMHLYAFPGHDADLFRDFAIYIFADDNATFLIKIDDQKVAEGSFEWRYIYKGSSTYNFMDVTVIVKKEGGDAQRSFDFTRIDLIDAPWQAKQDKKDEDEEEDKVPEVLKPYLSMGQGEFTIFILLRVFADVVSAFFAVLIAIKYAAIRADMAGTQRMF